MEALGTILCFMGVIVGVVGGIMILVAVFQESIFWGLLVLFFSGLGAGLIFVILHWDVAKKGLLTQLAGTGIMILGMVMMASGGGGGSGTL